ncbi:MAG: phytanoyl-CoA dioxygenase family protein [Acidimicrobiales bacterium]
MNDPRGTAVSPRHARFFEGFEPPPDTGPDRRLTHRQRAAVEAATAAVHAYRETVGRVWARRGVGPVQRRLGGRPGHVIRALGHARETHGGHRLPEAQMRAFEATGVVGPIPFLARDEALDLGVWVRELHGRDWDGNCAFGPDVHRAFQRSGMMADIVHSGQYQALFQPRLWSLLHRPEVTDPLSSLMGDDLICWRQQFFDKPPGAEGTFWHQASKFRIVSRKERLRPVEGSGLNPAMIQYTLWIALEDVDIENGALRMAPATFDDDRLERLGELAVDRPLEALASLPADRVRDTIELMLHGTDEFEKGKALLGWALSQCPDLFAGAELTSYPMRAGEGLIFTSLNLHGSHRNGTDRGRLALAARVVGPQVAVYEGWDRDTYITPVGRIRHPIDGLECIQMAGGNVHPGNRVASGVYPG